MSSETQIEKEIARCTEKLEAFSVEYERVRKKVWYWRTKRRALKDLLSERRHGQLPLLEHEGIGQSPAEVSL